MTRGTHTKPKQADRNIFRIKGGNIIKLASPLYSVWCATEYWGVMVHEKNRNDHTPGYQSLYVKNHSKNRYVLLNGISGNYMVVAVNAENNSFLHILYHTLGSFETEIRVFDNFDFCGRHINTMSPHEFRFEQCCYAFINLTLPSHCTFECFLGRIHSIHGLYTPTLTLPFSKINPRR